MAVVEEALAPPVTGPEALVGFRELVDEEGTLTETPERTGLFIGPLPPWAPWLRLLLDAGLSVGALGSLLRSHPCRNAWGGVIL